MKLIAKATHTYDGHTYHEGDTYDVPDGDTADLIVSNGMAARAPVEGHAAPPPRAPSSPVTPMTTADLKPPPAPPPPAPPPPTHKGKK